MTDHDKLLDQTARQIEQLTAEAFAELMRRIRAGEDPQSAIQAIMQTWEPAYRERLAEAFSATLARFVGPDELRDYPIGEMALSPRLYAHAAATTAVVRDIVQRHAAGFQDARSLTLQIYEGYGFRKDEPLKISPRNPKLPKYLRREILTDPTLAGQMARHFTKVSASQIKTPALRAAYLEAIDAMEKGRGSKVLERKLEVAYQERMRYHANRIAQTELHRAWMDKQAEELMADDTVEVVQFKMSGTHPRTDICDLFAKQDAYGLGPGLYPKEHAPRPPLHPFCRCGLISKRLISAKGAQFKPEAHRAYLRQVMADEGVSKAAQVVGSRAKLQTVLSGKMDVSQVLNQNRPVPYRLWRAGDAKDNALMEEHRAFYRDAISGQKSDNRHTLGPLTNANAVNLALGQTYTLNEVVLQESYLRHVHKYHGPGGFRKDENPITDMDIPHILGIVNGDKSPVFDGKYSCAELPLVKFVQKIEGVTYKVICEVRPGRRNRNLAVYNFYKR